jgi:hypothetical protein
MSRRYSRYSGYSSRSSGSSDGFWITMFSRAFASVVTYLLFALFYSCAAPHISYHYTPAAETAFCSCVTNTASGDRIYVDKAMQCMTDASYRFSIDTVLAGDPTTHYVVLPMTVTEVQSFYDCIDPEHNKYHFYVAKAYECLYNAGYRLEFQHEPVAWKEADPIIESTHIPDTRHRR